MRPERYPTYLGVTLDRDQHPSKHNQLPTLTLSLVYSTAEYCAPVWAASKYTSLVDAQLNYENHLRLAEAHQCSLASYSL